MTRTLPSPTRIPYVSLGLSAASLLALTIFLFGTRDILDAPWFPWDFDEFLFNTGAMTALLGLATSIASKVQGSSRTRLANVSVVCAVFSLSCYIGVVYFIWQAYCCCESGFC